MSKSSSASVKGLSVSLAVASSEGDDEAFPRLVSFPGGVPANSEDMEMLVGQKGTGKKRRRQVICTQNGLSYTGIDHGDTHSHKNNLCKYAVAKLDAATGIMTIYPTEHVYAMRPQVVASGHAADPDTLSTMTADERRTALTEEFGSSKKKRAMKQAASNSIEDSNVSGASAVELAITDSMLEVEASAHVDASEFALEQNRRLILPPYDEKTTVEADAYPLAKLMHGSVAYDIDAMYMEGMPADLAEQKSKKILPVSANAVRALLTQMEASATFLEAVTAAEEQLVEAGFELKTMEKHDAIAAFKLRCTALLYQCFLIKMFKHLISAKFQQAIAEELAEALQMPGSSSDVIFKTFGATSKKAGVLTVSLTKQGIDKLLGYILALGLHAHNFSYNITALSKELGLPETNLVKVARTMGCKIFKEGEAVSVMKLALPLKFPGRPRVQAKKK